VLLSYVASQNDAASGVDGDRTDVRIVPPGQLEPGDSSAAEAFCSLPGQSDSRYFQQPSFTTTDQQRSGRFDDGKLESAQA
jgi:hypothetical protein